MLFALLDMTIGILQKTSHMAIWSHGVKKISVNLYIKPWKQGLGYSSVSRNRVNSLVGRKKSVSIEYETKKLR